MVNDQAFVLPSGFKTSDDLILPESTQLQFSMNLLFKPVILFLNRPLLFFNLWGILRNFFFEMFDSDESVFILVPEVFDYLLIFVDFFLEEFLFGDEFQFFLSFGVDFFMNPVNELNLLLIDGSLAGFSFGDFVERISSGFLQCFVLRELLGC